MALKKTVPQYQLEALSGDEDDGLVQESHQPHTYTYKVPTVETFQSGKHRSKTFQEVYDQDSGYTQFILHNTRLTSRDMLSFQNFVQIQPQAAATSAHQKLLFCQRLGFCRL